MITFLMEYENYTFKEALTWLADRAGIELPKEEESAEAKKQADLRARILEVNREAGKYFYYQMKGPGGKRAYEYLRGRRDGMALNAVPNLALGQRVDF